MTWPHYSIESNTDFVEDVEVDCNEEHVVREEEFREAERFLVAHDPRSDLNDEEIARRQHESRRVAVHQEPVLHSWICKCVAAVIT